MCCGSSQGYLYTENMAFLVICSKVNDCPNITWGSCRD